MYKSHLLGCCYRDGRGVEPDQAKAAELFRLAAEKRYIPALCDLGLCYESGSGVDEDLEKAVECYTQSAEEGYAPAQCNLCLLYTSW